MIHHSRCSVGHLLELVPYDVATLKTQRFPLISRALLDVKRSSMLADASGEGAASTPMSSESALRRSALVLYWRELVS
jgi:hypothetical protein